MTSPELTSNQTDTQARLAAQEAAYAAVTSLVEQGEDLNATSLASVGLSFHVRSELGYGRKIKALAEDAANWKDYNQAVEGYKQGDAEYYQNMSWKEKFSWGGERGIALLTKLSQLSQQDAERKAIVEGHVRPVLREKPAPEPPKPAATVPVPAPVPKIIPPLAPAPPEALTPQAIEARSNHQESPVSIRGLAARFKQRRAKSKAARQQQVNTGLDITHPEPIATPEVEPKVSLEVGVAEKRRKGEDVILRNDETRIYGVFDGMGSNAGTAAEQAAKAINQYLSTTETRTIEEGVSKMRFAFEYARDAVRRYGHGGTTTAALAHVAEIRGYTYVFFANAGDSRIIFMDGQGNMFNMTTDQSVNGNALLNGFGPESENWPRVEDEFNSFGVKSGDKILICSDGITGDTPEQALTYGEFADAFGQPTAQASANRFVKLSKKNGDKSAIVLAF